MEKGLDGVGGGAGAESLGEEVGGGVAEEGVFEVGEEEAARHGRGPLALAPLWFFRNWGALVVRGGPCKGNDVDERTTHLSDVTSHSILR